MSRFPLFMSQACCVLLSAAVVAVGTAKGADNKGNLMSYGEARAFLAKHTELIELKNESGGRVAVAPEWQGRVMTSTCAGESGPSFGFVNRDYIEAGKYDPRFNNCGAEDRMWLCPEGGPFSLWFKPGVEQVMKNWYTPPALTKGRGRSSPKRRGRSRHDGAHEVPKRLGHGLRHRRDRNVRLLGTEDFRQLFGATTAATLARPDAKMVAYETVNQITNRGPAFSKTKGLISILDFGHDERRPEGRDHRSL